MFQLKLESFAVRQKTEVIFLDILRLTKYALARNIPYMLFLRLLFVKEKGELEDMTTKTRLSLGVKGSYLAAYLVLLLFSVSGLMLQGGSWILVGVAGWFAVILGWFFCYNYLRHRKTQKFT